MIEAILAEIGSDMKHFKSDNHLAAWAASMTRNTGYLQDIGPGDNFHKKMPLPY